MVIMSQRLLYLIRISCGCLYVNMLAVDHQPSKLFERKEIFFFFVLRPVYFSCCHMQGAGDMLILDRGYSLAKLPRFFEGAVKFS